MITCKLLYVVVGTLLGAAGFWYQSPELMILSPAFLGSAAVQAWLSRRPRGSADHKAGHRSLLANKF